MAPAASSSRQIWDRERFRLLRQFENWLELPMLILAVLWLVLLVVGMASRLNPMLEALAVIIWTVFILEFLVRLAVAPHKRVFLASRWTALLAVVVPAIRILRAGRVLRLLRRGARLREAGLAVRVAALNAEMRSLAATLKRRHFGWVAAATLLVTFAGAAGIQLFEHTSGPAGDLNGFGDSLWWTAMIMTTMGSEIWPRTPEGRLLCLLLALYAFALFGYVTATLASHFLSRDAEANAGRSSMDREVQELRKEVAALREQVAEPSVKGAVT